MADTRVRLAVAGAMGRMGRMILELASRDERFTVSAALAAPGCAPPGTEVRVDGRHIPVVESLDAECDVLIDFTTADGTIAWLDQCRSRGLPMLIGATGHNEEQVAQIRAASATLPIVKAGNCSIGVQAMVNALGRLAAELGEDYDVEIVETHHRYKIDAPSGTALMLVERIARATGRSRADAVFGREGKIGERPKGQIGVHAVRMGDIVGRHEVHFSGPGETITITHSAQSRETFAAGALRAAAWLVGRPPGMYSMRDVLG